MTKLEQEYEYRCKKISDINEHLPILKKYSSQCVHVTEFGTYSGNSSVGLLSGCPQTMVSIDVAQKYYNIVMEVVPLLTELAKEANINFTFVHKSTLEIKIAPTDLLFIDTIHTYAQLKQELYLHHNNVNKYIILHDTVANATLSVDIDGTRVYGQGLQLAINEFLNLHSEWEVKEKFTNNNGLLILERKNEKHYTKIISSFKKHDDRGSFENLSLVVDTDWPFVTKRMYICNNFVRSVVRAFHYHEHEQKGIICIKGAVKIVIVPKFLDNPNVKLDYSCAESFVLTEHDNKGIFVASEHANGWMSLTDDSSILVFSSSTIDESMNDDIRFDAHAYDWKVNWR